MFIRNVRAVPSRNSLHGCSKPEQFAMITLPPIRKYAFSVLRYERKNVSKNELDTDEDLDRIICTPTFAKSQTLIIWYRLRCDWFNGCLA